MDTKLAIGQRIVAARKRKNWEQTDLVRALGWKGPSRLSMYENGRRLPDPDTIRRIADLLDTSPAHLMFGDPPGFVLDAVEVEHVKLLRELAPATRDKILRDINWHFNQQYPGIRTSANPFAHLPAPATVHSDHDED